MGLKSACACTIEAVDIHLVIVKKKNNKQITISYNFSNVSAPAFAI